MARAFGIGVPSARRSSARWIALATLLASYSQPHAAAAVPPLDHVIVIVMENRSYDKVRVEPYIASLIADGSVFTNSYALVHPSQPNYFMLWSGSAQGVTSDACSLTGSPFATENLGHACEVAGLTWRAYSEDLPAAGSDTCRTDLYARKHDPWTHFGNLDHLNERPYSDLAVDIANGALPNLAFVVPNLCNDMHSCSTEQGDVWLESNVPAMLAALGPTGMLVLTWDEGPHSGDNHILTVFIGEPVRRGFAHTDTVTHYTVLRALCEGLGLTPFAEAANEPTISDVWGTDRSPSTNNLCTNPSFESSTTGWSRYHSTTLTRVPGGRDGAYALEIQGPTTTAKFGLNDSPNWVDRVLAGACYRYAAWVRSAAGTGSARLQIREFLNGAQVGAMGVSPLVPLSPDWQMVSTDFAVTSPGATLSFQVVAFPAGPGEVFQVDDVSITLACNDHAPVVSAPTTVSGAEGSPISVNVTAGDPDGNPIATLAADLAGLPPVNDAVFTADPEGTSGTLVWTPRFTDGGRSYSVSFTAANTLSGSAFTTISVANVNRPPRASLGVAPATGVAPLVATADASASTDPDGPLASYRFDFGDGTVLGPQGLPLATHTFAPGTWIVTLRVDDGEGGADSTAAAVTATSNLVNNPSFETSTAGWKPSAGATLTRVSGGYDGDYALEVQGPATVSMFEVNDAPDWVDPVAGVGTRYRYTAWVRSVAGTGGARLRIREFLGGVQQGATVRSPVAQLSADWQMLTADYVATTDGSALSFQVTDQPIAPGESFLTDNISIAIVPEDAAPTVAALHDGRGESLKGAGPSQDPESSVDSALESGPLRASVSPNPLASQGALSFATHRAGFVSAQVFDVRGRCARTLIQEELPAGRHVWALDRRDDGGASLPAGVYFYRVRTPEGTVTGRFLLLR